MSRIGDARVSQYSFGDFRTGIKVTLRHHEKGHWAIEQDGAVYTRLGEWEYEPMPSSRDDAFIARARWSEREALEVAERLAGWMRREADEP